MKRGSIWAKTGAKPATGTPETTPASTPTTTPHMARVRLELAIRPSDKRDRPGGRLQHVALPRLVRAVRQTEVHLQRAAEGADADRHINAQGELMQGDPAGVSI